MEHLGPAASSFVDLAEFLGWNDAATRHREALASFRKDFYSALKDAGLVLSSTTDNSFTLELQGQKFMCAIDLLAQGSKHSPGISCLIATDPNAATRYVEYPYDRATKRFISDDPVIRFAVDDFAEVYCTFVKRVFSNDPSGISIT
jgi:hypothetical protein